MIIDFSFFSCGYVLMPEYIRTYSDQTTKLNTTSMSLEIRILAVRHIRTTQIKSILKVQIKTTIIGKQKTTENQSFTSK